MKKLSAILMVAVFILSMVPLAAAENTAAGEGNMGEDTGSVEPTLTAEPVLISAEPMPVDSEEDELVEYIKSNRERFMNKVEECVERASEKYPDAKPERVKMHCMDLVKLVKEVRQDYGKTGVEALETRLTACVKYLKEKNYDKSPEVRCKALAKSEKSCVDFLKSKGVTSPLKKCDEFFKARVHIAEKADDVKVRMETARARIQERVAEFKEGVALKMERFKEAQAERLEKLEDAELKKIALLDRARAKKLADMDESKLKEELSKLKVKKVKAENLFKKRVVAADKLKRARENYKNAEERYQKAKKSFEEEKRLFEKYKNVDEEKAIEHAKKFLDHAADVVVETLEKIKAKVEENDDLSEEEASEIIADIEERIAAVKEAQEDVNAAEAKEDVKAAGEVIISEWNKVKARVREHVGKLINAKVGEIIERSEHLEKKLDEILAEMEEKGIEVDEIETKVDLFSIRVEEARNKFKTAESLFEQIKDMKGEKMTKDRLNTIKTLSEQAKALSKEAHSALKEAHKILMDIVRSVKQAGGGEVDLEVAEDEYVEVVEEEEEESEDEIEDEVEEESEEEMEDESEDEEQSETDEESEEETENEEEVEDETEEEMEEDSESDEESDETETEEDSESEEQENDETQEDNSTA